jgi:hypothetical protein
MDPRYHSPLLTPSSSSSPREAELGSIPIQKSRFQPQRQPSPRPLLNKILISAKKTRQSTIQTTRQGYHQRTPAPRQRGRLCCGSLLLRLAAAAGCWLLLAAAAAAAAAAEADAAAPEDTAHLRAGPLKPMVRSRGKRNQNPGRSGGPSDGVVRTTRGGGMPGSGLSVCRREGARAAQGRALAGTPAAWGAAPEICEERVCGGAVPPPPPHQLQLALSRAAAIVGGGARRRQDPAKRRPRGETGLPDLFCTFLGNLKLRN